MNQYPNNCAQQDHGPEPHALNIEKAALGNDNFRTALWTGKNLQLTVMKILPGQDIGIEMHPHTDQFLRIESGCGMVMMGTCEDSLTYRRSVCSGWGIFIPAGTWHNLVNTGGKPIKLYSIYAPPNHPHGTVHITKEQASHEHD